MKNIYQWPCVVEVGSVVEARHRPFNGTPWRSLTLKDVDNLKPHSLPIPSWSVHVDSHAEQFEKNVLSPAAQFFGKTSFQRQRPRLREVTINLIGFKRSCLDYGHAQGLRQQPEFKTELKAVEAMVRAAVRVDPQHFYADLVQQLAQAGDLHDAKLVYKLLSRLGARKPKSDGRPLPFWCTKECQLRLLMNNSASG